MKILQIAHGRIYPAYSSAYATRCYDIFKRQDRKIVSVGGFTFKDFITDEIEQYRSLLYTAYSFLKRERYFEIGISKSGLVRKKFKNRINQLVESYNIITFEGPWNFPLVKDKLDGKFVIYDVHNVEYLLRSGNKYQDTTYNIEKALIERADLIYSLSKDDIESIVRIYKKDREKIVYVPQIIPPPSYNWHGYNSNDFVFIGSIYQPNLEALRIIEKIAESHVDLNFHILGDFSKVKKKNLKNMIYHGLVSEELKNQIFDSSLSGLNPVMRGGGRNLKMIDYLSHGLPVITTPVGFRGFDREFWDDLIFITEPEKFTEIIHSMTKNRNYVKSLSVKIYEKYKRFYEIESSSDPVAELVRRLK